MAALSPQSFSGGMNSSAPSRSAAAVKFLAAAMINEHFAAVGDRERVTEEFVGRNLGGFLAPVLAPIFEELADCMTPKNRDGADETAVTA